MQRLAKDFNSGSSGIRHAIFSREVYCATFIRTANVLRERRARRFYVVNRKLQNDICCSFFDWFIVSFQVLNCFASRWLTHANSLYASYPATADQRPGSWKAVSFLTLRFDIIHSWTRGFDGDLTWTGTAPRVVYCPKSEPGRVNKGMQGNIFSDCE